MILHDETKLKYGYAPADLSKASTKPILLRCDICDTTFEKKFVLATYQQAARHSCSKLCAAKAKALTMRERDGYSKAATKTTQTSLARYGAARASSLPETKQKVKTTCRERYGVDNPMQNPSVASESCRRRNKSTTAPKGFGGRMFLFESEWSAYLRRMPVRYIRRTHANVCAVCGQAASEGRPLEHSHRIGFHQGVTQLGLTPDWLDSHDNIVSAHRGSCNTKAELTLQAAMTVLREKGVTRLPAWLPEQVLTLWTTFQL